MVVRAELPRITNAVGQVNQLLFQKHIPQSKSLVPTAAGLQVSSMAEGQDDRVTSVSFKHRELLGADRVPKVNVPVLAGGRQPYAIGMPVHAEYQVGMVQGGGHLSGLQIENL